MAASTGGPGSIGWHQEFSTSKISASFIEVLHAEDTAGSRHRDTLKESIESYKDNVQYANNHFNSDTNVKHVLFRAKKAFFNHKYQTQELLRSQHIYKLAHEIKYTPDKNIRSYPDVLEDGYKQVLKVDDKPYEIRDALLKWYSHRLDCIHFVRSELNKQYFKLFASNVDEYQTQSARITQQLNESEAALLEVEDFIRNLKSERFFKSSKAYEKQHLPELSVACSGNVIVQSTFAKILKNFPYVSQRHVKNYFNDFNNLHYCTRKIKKVRLVNDFLPYKVQMRNIIRNAKSATTIHETALDEDHDNIVQEMHRIYNAKRTYILAKDKAAVERNVSDIARSIGIMEDVNIDFGCLLLFAIDKRFDVTVKLQSEAYFDFHPYDLKSTFKKKTGKQKFEDRARELTNAIDHERNGSDNIKIRQSSSWIDKLQIIQSSEPEQREQQAILGLYDDTLVKGWLKFLLYTDETLINQKISKDISVLKDRYFTMNNKKQFEEIFYQFYSRYLKLLFMKSRKSLIAILSYMNYFRCLQKNINLSYVELLYGHSIEGASIAQQQQANTQQVPSSSSSIFDPTQPLSKQHEKLSAKIHDDKFFLTNPSIANYGNLTSFIQKKQAEQRQRMSGTTATMANQSDEQDEPSILYQEEVIEMDGDGNITIRDHNRMKILYDASAHDFHMIIDKIAQICSFYFHFRIKHDLSQKQKEKGLFKDNFDRESLVDMILSLEAQYYLKKVRLLQSIEKVLKNTYYPDLRKQLIEMMAQIMARRPRVNLFENNILECYHYEIQIFHNKQLIIDSLFTDLLNQELHVHKITSNLNPPDLKLEAFFQDLKKDSSSVTNKSTSFCWYMSGLAKLIVNIEQNRSQFNELIPCSSSDPSTKVSEILRCESCYLDELLETTTRVLSDSEGQNLFPDFLDFAYMENDTVLDSPENYDVLNAKIATFIEERVSSKSEQAKLSFDSFSMLEFIKVRMKLRNFLYGLGSLLDIYRLQVHSIGEDFATKFEANIDVSVLSKVIPSANSNNSQLAASVLNPPRTNYLKLLLDIDAVKVAKEISVLDNWMALITKQQSLDQITQFLESLILCSQLAQNYVIANNIYTQSVLNDMPKEFSQKISQSAPEYFRNVFETKKTIACETVVELRQTELLAQKSPVIKKDEEANASVKTTKVASLQIFCKRLKREVQFEAMKIQTLLQRNQLERFSKKLPFEQPIFKFTPITPVINEAALKNRQGNYAIISSGNSSSGGPGSIMENYTNNAASIDEDFENKGEVFFDSLGCAVNIFNLPSVEQILAMSHGDFESIMTRYGKANLPDEYDDEEGAGQGGADEDSQRDKSQASGGKEWMKIQETKLENQQCMFTHNKLLKLNKGSSSLKGFRQRAFLEHEHLLYLRKSQLFILWKILGNMLNLVSLCTFECSLEADAMDMLYFSHGQLGYEKCKIEAVQLQQQNNNLLDANVQAGETVNSNVKSLKDLAFANRNAIPVFKRNELRLRRDIEQFESQMKSIENSVKLICVNPKIADQNEAILTYIEKVQNRRFLSVLLLLMQQLNASREKGDFEYMQRLRQLILDLNFEQVQHLARFEDDSILLAKNVQFTDTSANFTQSPDLKIFESSSPFMAMIRVIFWDTRPKIEENLHSTIAMLNPNRYFFKQFMRFSNVLDKGLAGMAQSRITELSVTKKAIEFTVHTFLRNNFIFENDDPIKFERMATKIVNIQVRNLVLREIYFVRKLNILPFEMLPNNGADPLKQITEILKQKVVNARKKVAISKLQQPGQIEANIGNTTRSQTSVATSSAVAAAAAVELANKSPFSFEENAILDLVVNCFQNQILLYEEAEQFYYRENAIMAKWIQYSRSLSNPGIGGASGIGDSRSSLGQPYSSSSLIYDPIGLNREFSTGSLEVLDVLSILSNFTAKVFFDSAEVKTLDKSEALVIAKDHLKQHLHGINLDLIDLISAKYSKFIQQITQKCRILENDVVFQKKQNAQLQNKIAFLESNIQNIVEAQVASKSNDLIQEIQQLQKKAAYSADQRQMDKIKIHQQIAEQFTESVRQSHLTNEAILSRFYDFRQGQKLEVYNMVETIKDHNLRLLKDSIAKALEDHGGASTAMHIVDGVWSTSFAERREEELKKKPAVAAAAAGAQSPSAANTAAQSIHLKNPNSSVMMQSMSKQQQSSYNNNNNTITAQTDESRLDDDNNMHMGSLSHELHDQLLPADVFERLELQNKEAQKLMASFRLLRAFSNMKLACVIEKYENRIREINENNSSNEQLYRDKKEMQAQTESMKDNLIALKKTMAIMDYQNEILRRDVQRSRKDRIKAIRQAKEKDDAMRLLEEKIEQQQKDRLHTYTNFQSNNFISRNFSSHSIRKSYQKSSANKNNQNDTPAIDTSLVVIQPPPPPPPLQAGAAMVAQSYQSGILSTPQQQQKQVKHAFFAPELSQSQQFNSLQQQQQQRPNSNMNMRQSTEKLSSSSSQSMLLPKQQLSQTPVASAMSKKKMHLSNLLTKPQQQQSSAITVHSSVTSLPKSTSQQQQSKTLQMTYKIKNVSAVHDRQPQQQ